MQMAEISMFLKMIGTCLMIAAGTGMGIGKGRELTRREENLSAIYRMIIMLKGEIRYGCASLPDAFHAVAGKLPPLYGSFLKEAAIQMEEGGGRPLGEIFRSHARKLLSVLELKDEEKELFLSLGDRLGYLDLDMQLKQLTLCEQDVYEAREKLRLEMPEKKKLYRSLGISAGLLLSILLL